MDKPPVPDDLRKELFDDLEGILREKIAQRPDDVRLHIRLAELYYEAGREEAFLRQAQTVRNLFRGNLDSADWQQLVTSGRRIAPDSPLFAGERVAATETVTRRLGDTSGSRPYFEAIQERYASLKLGQRFLAELDRALVVLANRPSSLLHVRRYSEKVGGAQIALKREDLMGPGTPLIAAVAGQVLLAKKLGFTEVVTGSVYGQKGVVMASMAASFGLRATIYMDGEDTHQQSANVLRMWACGADVEIIDPQTRNTDPRVVALRHCLMKPDERFMVMGLESAPEPYPTLTLDCVGVVGRELRMQVRSQFKRGPDLLVARGKGTADALGFLSPFLGSGTRMVCVNAGGSLQRSPKPITDQDPFAIGGKALTEAQRNLANAILEASDYPAVEREHSLLQATGEVEYVEGDPAAARLAIKQLARLEGVIPAVRSAHALAWAAAAAKEMDKDQVVVVNLVEQAEKDITDIGEALGLKL